MKRWNKGLIAFSVGVITGISFLSACTTVKPYQKSRLNDGEMTLAPRLSQKFEQSFELYREAASGGNGGKSGGGCGCN
jgi:hypothetical protein